MRRLFAIAAVVALTTLAGCGDGDTEDASGTDKCTAANARQVQQSYITNATFDVTCVRVADKSKPFYFINNDDTIHTVTLEPGTSEAFDAELPRKNSTYPHSFENPGTYVITCKRHAEKLTLIVV